MDHFGHHSQFEESFEQQVQTNDSNLIDNHRYEKNNYSGKLFVGGVAWDTTEDAFADYFSQYGEIVDSVIMTDRYSGRPRGFGFVTFADPAVADQILEINHVIDGRAVEVKKTVPREEMAVKEVLETKKIFVGGMPPSLTEVDLEEYFSWFGKIVEHQIMLDHISGRSRGFGFITFETADAVEKVLSCGKVHELGGKQVEIKKAEPRRHGGDYSAGPARPHGCGSSGHGRYSSRVQYDGKMDLGYSGYGGYDYYGGYGGSNNGGNSAGFYCGYAGYGFGYGYGYGSVNPQYGAGYGYSMSGSHGGPMAVYGGITGLDTGAGCWGSRGNGSDGSSEIGRLHPYRK